LVSQRRAAKVAVVKVMDPKRRAVATVEHGVSDVVMVERGGEYAWRVGAGGRKWARESKITVK
jgi:hypothetical protein